MINKLKRNIPIFSTSKDSIWLDEHLAPQMLAAHLDTASDGATRREEYINQSMCWLTENVRCRNFRSCWILAAVQEFMGKAFMKQAIR